MEGEEMRYDFRERGCGVVEGRGEFVWVEG